MHTIEKLTYILNKLKIDNSKKIAIDITSGNDFQYYNNALKNINIQNGGSKTIIEFVKYKGKTFTFHKYNVDSTIHYSLHPKNDLNLQPECIWIMVDKQTRSCEIHNISYDDRCFSEEGDIPTGSILLKVALKLIETIKNHYNIKYVQLTDNSRKYCKGTNGIVLADMYTLMYGTTWYGSYGFRPSDEKGKIDEKLNKFYERNKKIINNTMLKDVPQLEKYIIKAFSKIKPEKLHLSNILGVYDKMKNYPLGKFIQTFIKYYDKTCELFSEIYLYLYKDLKLHSFYKHKFIKLL